MIKPPFLLLFNNLKSFIKSNDTGLRGLEEVEFVIQNENNLEIITSRLSININNFL